MTKTIILFILTFLKYLFNPSLNADQRRLKENQKLADAIRRGDGKTIAQIRERRRNYKNL